MPPQASAHESLIGSLAGRPESKEALLALVYDDLRHLAGVQMRQERSDHTLQPTALVHEAFVRLVREEGLEDRARTHFLAWEDRTPFEAIYYQFNLRESEVIKLMRANLKRSSFNRWRKRVNSGISQKSLKKRNPAIDRFRCSRQRSISMNKISKR